MSAATSSSFEFWFACSDTTPCPDPIEAKIRSLASLREGWNYGEGRAPSQAVVEKTISLYQEGKSLGLDAEVFAVGDGDIEISLFMRDHFMDILICDDGRMNFSYEVGIGKQYRIVESIENISRDEVEKRLCQLPKQCGALESSGIIITGSKNDFPLAVSRTAEEGFRFLTENASRSVTIPPFANIFGNFTVQNGQGVIP